MRAIVVYESMYGNTHRAAEAVGEGLRGVADTEVFSVHDAPPSLLAEADLVVVGGPTHAHGMSHESTRTSAVEAIAKPDNDLTLDPDAAGDGIREWIAALGTVHGRAAAFDTRVDMSALLSGRASKGIAKQLAHHGFDLIAEPESFLVTKETHLEPDEVARARAWGERLAGLASAG